MASDDNNSPPPDEREEIPPEDGEITPPKSRGKRSHKSRHHETSSSSSDESSSDESSGHESDPKSDGSEKEEPSTKETEDDYQRFDTQSKAPKKFKLPANMEKYISNTFTTFVGDKVLQESVLDVNPAPNIKALNTQNIDDYIDDIGDSLGKPTNKESDKLLAKCQSRVTNVMGPLGRLWHNLELVRTKKTDATLDLFECMKLVEQSITLLGQAKISISYSRRLHILFRLTNDFKKAKKMLQKHESSLSKPQKTLFGKGFYKALRKSTKIKKSSRDISNHFGGSHKKSSRPPQTRASRGDYRRTQPFRKEPSFQTGRGGGRQVSFRGSAKAPYTNFKGYSRGKPIKVRFRFGCHKQPSSPTEGHGICGIQILSTDSTSREAETLPLQLANSDSGSVNFTNCRGSTNSLSVPSFSSVPSKADSSQSNRDQIDKRSDRGDACKGGDKNCSSSERGILKPCVFSSQKRRGQQTCDQPESTEFVCALPALQNGGSPPFEADYNQGRPYDQNRSKGRLLLCANKRESSTTPEVSMGGDAVPIHLSTFRACPSTPPVYKIVETGCGTLTEDRLKDDYLFGRHNNLQPVQGRDNEGQGLNPMVTPSSRVCCQLEKIHTGPQLPDGVLGVCYRQQGDEIIPPSDKNQSFGSGLHRVSTQQRMFGQSPCTNVRQIDLNRTGDPSGPFTLSSLADATGEGSAGGEVLRNNCTPESTLQGRPALVDRPNIHLEWSLNNFSCARHDHSDRCVIEGVGGGMPGGTHQGPVEQQRVNFAPHQCFRTESSYVCFEGLYPEQIQSVSPSEDRQQISGCLYYEKGGDKVSNPNRSGPGTLGLCPTASNNFDGRVPPRVLESGGRLGVQTFYRLKRLETESLNIQTNQSGFGSSGSRPVCKQAKCSTGHLCELVPGPICLRNRCISNIMVPAESLQLSTLFSHRPVPCQSEEGPSNNCNGNSHMAGATMVRGTARDVVQPTNFAASSTRHPEISQTGVTSLSDTGKSSSCGMDGYRESILAKGVSRQTANLLCNHSWRKGTTTAYNSAWHQWSSWCNKRTINPFCATLAAIADYLSEMYASGKSYRTINSHRSAISAFHDPVDGCKVGQHELVCKVVNACFNANPPQPRYIVTWDVDAVLNYICKLGNNADLHIKNLTMKLGMLLALASAGRSSDLRALDLRFMSIGDGIIHFQLGRLTKSRRIGQKPIELAFHAFGENPVLCVVSTLLCYLKRTEQWRSGQQRNQLLLSYVRPHKEVVPCTIAGWLVQIMKNAGVDTSVFRAHSTRGASTSKARAMGLSCQEIMKMAKWKKESTFKRHYLRDIVDTPQDGFQKSVLQKVGKNFEQYAIISYGGL